VAATAAIVQRRTKERMSKYFIDTEFIEDGRTIDLVSIGIVCDDGREFYGQNMYCDFSKASDWVKEHVLPSLSSFDMETLKPIINWEQHGGVGEWYSPGSLAAHLSARMAGTGFIQMPDPDVEFWGYYSDYDWVVICQLFGTMMQLPDGWPKFCMDLKQWCVQLGDPRLPEQGKGEHNALSDARWNKQAYDFLKDYEINLEPVRATLVPGTCARCQRPIGVAEGECTGWHPDIKCGCGFEMAGGAARGYRFCPYCSKTLVTVTKDVDHQEFSAPPPGATFCIDYDERHVSCPVAIAEREYRSKLADAVSKPEDLSVPPPRPGAEPLTRPPKKLSKRQQAIEARRNSDRIGQAVGRDDIDYQSDELPSPE
jgi:hypothetical protein